jgi:NADPH-dependent ferric siderophore reductase
MTDAVATLDATPFALFRVRVLGIRRVGPNIHRFTFTGPDLAHFADNGFDQRIKLVFPLPGVGLTAMPPGPDWYGQWRELPDHLRNPLRTYTVRAVRPELEQLDVDFAVHGRVGVASAWAFDAAPGDELVVVGPDRRFRGRHGGIDFVPPAHTGRYLLAGDETALPAIASVLERLPADACGAAVLEVADAADAAALPIGPLGMDVTVLGRDGREPGAALVPAVQRAAGLLCAGRSCARVDLEDVDVDSGMLWEVPTDEQGEALQDNTDLYAWLAGEAGVIKTLRRHLVAERGLDRRSVAFMGYWRQGRQEAN